MSSSALVDVAPALMFRDVSCQVHTRDIVQWPPFKKKTIQIIGDCSGLIHKGESVCILGGSGAGKTTLLDILSKRKNSGTIGGEILYNGKTYKGKSLPTVVAGYVRQSDYLIGTLTVYQTLKYAAKLRCHHIPEKEWQDRIEKLLVALNLAHKKHQLVGDSLVRGLSGGESRRLSIAIEMLNNPEILFLDEPTTGLDSSSSLTVAALLQKLARSRNTASICTIHQPSREVFSYFDKCFVLAKEPGGYGRMVYFGPVAALERYLDRIEYPLPKGANIADFVIQLCSSQKDPALLGIFGAALEGTPGRARASLDITPSRKSAELSPVRVTEAKTPTRKSMELSPSHMSPSRKANDHQTNNPTEANSVVDMIASWNKSIEREVVMQELEACKDKPAATATHEKWRPPWMYYQIWVLFLRRMQSLLNDKDQSISPIVIFFVIDFILATAFWRLGYGREDVQNRVSLIFFLIIMTFLSAQPYENLVINERALFLHEKDAKLYGAIPYYLSILLSSMPFNLVIQMGYAAALYWTTNLNDDVGRFWIFMLEYALCILLMMHYALALGAAMPTEEAAIGASSVCFIVFILFNGFFIVTSSIKDWWIWAYWSTPLTYVFYVGINNEFRDVVFDCGRSNATDCGFKDGAELLKFYGAENADLVWPYIAVTLGFTAVFAIITIAALRFLRFDKR